MYCILYSLATLTAVDISIIRIDATRMYAYIRCIRYRGFIT